MPFPLPADQPLERHSYVSKPFFLCKLRMDSITSQPLCRIKWPGDALYGTQRLPRARPQSFDRQTWYLSHGLSWGQGLHEITHVNTAPDRSPSGPNQSFLLSSGGAGASRSRAALAGCSTGFVEGTQCQVNPNTLDYLAQHHSISSLSWGSPVSRKTTAPSEDLLKVETSI